MTLSIIYFCEPYGLLMSALSIPTKKFTVLDTVKKAACSDVHESEEVSFYSSDRFYYCSELFESIFSDFAYDQSKQISCSERNIVSTTMKAVELTYGEIFSIDSMWVLFRNISRYINFTAQRNLKFYDLGSGIGKYVNGN